MLKYNKIHTTKLLLRSYIVSFYVLLLFRSVKCISHFIVHSIKNPFPFVSNPHVCSSLSGRSVEIPDPTAGGSRVPGLAAKSLIIELEPRVEVVPISAYIAR